MSNEKKEIDIPYQPFIKLKITQESPLKHFPHFKNATVTSDRMLLIWECIILLLESPKITIKEINKMISIFYPHERLEFLKKIPWNIFMMLLETPYINPYVTQSVTRQLIINQDNQVLEKVRNRKALGIQSISITNHFSLQYNFVDIVFNKVLEKLKQCSLFKMIVENYHIIFGESMVQHFCNMTQRKNSITYLDLYFVDDSTKLNDHRQIPLPETCTIHQLAEKFYIEFEANKYITIDSRIYHNVDEYMHMNEAHLCYDAKSKQFYCNSYFYVHHKLRPNKESAISIVKIKEKKVDKLIFYRPKIKTKEWNKPLDRCYQCKKIFRKSTENILEKYKDFCVHCGMMNHQRSIEHISLPDKYALVTGGRLKIGYNVCLELLRGGCKVITTTRFPINALYRYQQDPDYDKFKNNLSIYGLDLRNLKMVEKFIDHLITTYPQLDVLINNASQTFTYTDEYYQTMYEYENLEFTRATKLLQKPKDDNECKELVEVKADKQIVSYSRYDMELLKDTKLQKWTFETDKYEESKLIKGDFWRKMIEDVSMQELIETNVVNHIVPNLLIGKLKQLMKKGNNKKYIINVTCREGIFGVKLKTPHHAHTNSAKAALNMVTRTVAEDYKKHRIYVNSVDPGFVSYALNLQKETPVSCENAGKRIVYPILLGEKCANDDEIVSGKIWRHYNPDSKW